MRCIAEKVLYLSSFSFESVKKYLKEAKMNKFILPFWESLNAFLKLYSLDIFAFNKRNKVH